jgi:putative membrane protein
VVVLLVVTRLLSIGWAVVTLYDFTLTRQASDLRVSYGLLTRVALTLRLPRIQSVRQTQTLLHRLFDRVALTVDSAGDGVNSEHQEGRQAAPRLRWLAPICTPDTAAAIIHMALPMIDATADPDWRPLAPGARARIFRKTLLATAAILGVPTVALLSWASLPMAMSLLMLSLLVPLAWWRAVTYTKQTRWALTRDALMFRSGWLTRHLHIVPRNRVQAVEIRVSPFDRRQRMGTLIVDTAGAGATPGPVRIPYLESATVARLAQALYRFEGEELAIPSPAPR